MPFPWKKVKSTRISQLVNDHLHISQKRRDGSSLVVATGFPTSLIDLFIKNREKLKKPSKKKRRSQPIASSDDVNDPVIEGSPISCPFPPPPSTVGSPSPQRHSPSLSPPSSCENEICALGSSGGGSEVGGVDEEHRGGGERGRDVNGVLMGVSTMFVVVVLALATKRLAVVITISAVLLLFLECVGKHCGGLSKPFAAAKAAVQSGGRLLLFLRYRKLEEKQERLIKPVPLSIKSSATRCPDQEIQAVESKVYYPSEIQPEKEMMDESLSRERLGYQEIELVEMAMKREESICDDFKRKSRKARIKSQMNKIVPKKFRGSKKHQDLQSPLIVKDESFILSEEQVDQCNNGEESEHGSISSSVSDGGCREEDGKSDICSDRRLSDVKIEGKGEVAAARRYILLCLIVLVGLIGGRPFALVLTLTWFLLLKLGQKLPTCL
ncbi:hypothetical protein C2S53_010070 [Perilla frutescens var. hirtella]|uniref:Uncharacterized protein n=1 Tax=Perilla frutescens var. hirtella TaxID=608512 RepID=A0AAD4JBG0_PERFH|nr:hypothetical protein C2S53_010070 [Perilla frutescens var. hirtella]